MSLGLTHYFNGIYIRVNNESITLLQDIEDIYFLGVNTKYISSSAVKKISIFHECAASVKMLIFSPHEMKFILYLP